jgi:D-alanyl-lipoteichoic acid acyltransferase DltB (MBOAT superfamily)
MTQSAGLHAIQLACLCSASDGQRRVDGAFAVSGCGADRGEPRVLCGCGAVRHGGVSRRGSRSIGLSRRAFRQIARRIAAAVILNIGLIGYFKYRNLLLGDAGQSGSYIDTALPLGISFYSLQALAYHVDVVRKISGPARSFSRVLPVQAFFPQLIAGPIVRAPQVLPQIQRLFDGRPRRHRLLAFGFGLIVLGLAKKVLLADSLAPTVDEIFTARPETAYRAWLGAVLFTFQIYFDFSGYSDIAIGSAYLLGIRLPWNFRTPYMSTSPRAFWQRWHISLSTWIRDYLYIPLGGGRGNPLRAAAVLIGTMALAGLWHGAKLHLHRLGGRVGPVHSRRAGPAPVNVPAQLTWLVHMLVVILLWVIFRSPNWAMRSDIWRPCSRSGWPAGRCGRCRAGGAGGSRRGGIVRATLGGVAITAPRRALCIAPDRWAPASRAVCGIGRFARSAPDLQCEPFIYFRF